MNFNCWTRLQRLRLRDERGWIAQDVNDAPPQLKYEQTAIRD
ncbi:hypothetical protein [Acidianus infernus]|nr:hypothetical protein [Acidianus infernus]